MSDPHTLAIQACSVDYLDVSYRLGVSIIVGTALGGPVRKVLSGREASLRWELLGSAFLRAQAALVDLLDQVAHRLTVDGLRQQITLY